MAVSMQVKQQTAHWIFKKWLPRHVRAVTGGAGWAALLVCRLGQNRRYTPYMTVSAAISLPKIP